MLFEIDTNLICYTMLFLATLVLPFTFYCFLFGVAIKMPLKKQFPCYEKADISNNAVYNL